MAVTIGIDEVKRAIRVGDGEAETAEVERLLEVASVIINEYAPSAPSVIQNEAAIRLIGYFYDQPTISKRGEYSDAVRNSGMAALLSNYRRVRAPGIGTSTAPAASGATSEVIDAEIRKIETLIANLEAQNSSISVAIDALKTQVADQITRLVSLPETGSPGDVLTLDSSIPDTGFGWKTPSAEGVIPVPPDPEAIDKSYELGVDTDGLVSWVEPSGGGANIPSAPSADGFNRHYDLQVDADGVVSWALERNEGEGADIPNAPNAGSSDERFDLFVETDGTVSWRESIGGGSNVPNSPGRVLGMDVNYNLNVDSSGNASWEKAFAKNVPDLTNLRISNAQTKYYVVSVSTKLKPTSVAWRDFQIDWEETSTASANYIANKPTIPSSDDFATKDQLAATNAALNALDDDVQVNSRDIASKAAQSALVALNQEVNRFGTTAESNRVKLQALKIPNAPDAGASDITYGLEVATDGDVTWQPGGSGGGLVGAETTLLGQIRFSRADTLNQSSATKNFGDSESDAIRAFLALADEKDLLTVFRITFQGDGGSVIATQEYFGNPVHLPTAHVPSALSHIDFNLPYAQVTGDAANASRGEVSIRVPEAGKKVSASLDVSSDLKSNNALRNTTIVDVFLYGRKFQGVKIVSSDVPQPPAAKKYDVDYNLNVDRDGAVSWEAVSPPGLSFTKLITVAVPDYDLDYIVVNITGNAEIKPILDFMNRAKQKWVYFRVQPPEEVASGDSVYTASSQWVDMGPHALDFTNINTVNRRWDSVFIMEETMKVEVILENIGVSGQNFGAHVSQGSTATFYNPDGYNLELIGVTYES